LKTVETAVVMGSLKTAVFKSKKLWGFTTGTSIVSTEGRNCRFSTTGVHKIMLGVSLALTSLSGGEGKVLRGV
jgi:hypothetical protein